MKTFLGENYTVVANGTSNLDERDNLGDFSIQQELNSTVSIGFMVGKVGLELVLGDQTTTVLTWNTGISELLTVSALSKKHYGYIKVGKLRLELPFCYF